VTRLDTFRPTSDGPTALFLDTSGLFAYFHPDAAENEAARAFLSAVGENRLPYRPLVTNTYVVDELATLLRSKGTHEQACAGLARTLDSEAVTVLPETDDRFGDARAAFEQYDDHEISFTDHLIAAHMHAESITHVFAYDGDFETLGFEQLPRE
jgi:predicted nucleic acid-binding protein